MNSIGSVIPVRNDVNAADSNIPFTTALFLPSAVLYIARAAAGNPNIIGKNPPVIVFVAAALKCFTDGSASCAKNIFCPPATICPATS